MTEKIVIIILSFPLTFVSCAMIRKISLTFVFFLSLASAYAKDVVVDELSPVMKCLVYCRGHGGDMNTCINICVE